MKNKHFCHEVKTGKHVILPQGDAKVMEHLSASLVPGFNGDIMDFGPISLKK